LETVIAGVWIPEVSFPSPSLSLSLSPPFLLPLAARPPLLAHPPWPRALPRVAPSPRWPAPTSPSPPRRAPPPRAPLPSETPPRRAPPRPRPGPARRRPRHAPAPRAPAPHAGGRALTARPARTLAAPCRALGHALSRLAAPSAAPLAVPPAAPSRVPALPEPVPRRPHGPCACTV
jgi:hypothetical protein